jgi:hypothetical protein
MLAMIEAHRFPALVLLSVAASVGASGMQQPPARPAYHQQPGVGLKEIRVDERCRILLEEPAGFKGKAKGRKDDVICHLESQHTSNHIEKSVVDGVPARSSVTIEEQEFVLQDVTDEPVTFVVEQPVGQDWQVDSDPQPTNMIGNIAEFRVIAQPGEIVRLHVGLRHAKTKMQKVKDSTGPASSAS